MKTRDSSTITRKRDVFKVDFRDTVLPFSNLNLTDTEITQIVVPSLPPTNVFCERDEQKIIQITYSLILAFGEIFSYVEIKAPVKIGTIPILKDTIYPTLNNTETTSFINNSNQLLEVNPTEIWFAPNFFPTILMDIKEEGLLGKIYDTNIKTFLPCYVNYRNNAKTEENEAN